MSALRQDLAFHFGSGAVGAAPSGTSDPGLVPALCARYRDLSSLRYDFPVVLLHESDGHDALRSLSSIVDEVLREAAHGEEASRLRMHVFELERQIRAAAIQRERGRLSTVWERIAAGFGSQSELHQDSLRRARAALAVDGELVDCDAGLAGQILRHVWQVADEAKARRFRAHAGHLAGQLAEILRADFLHSAAGRSPVSLTAAFGGPLQREFDLDAMAAVLAEATPSCTIDEDRRRRLQELVAILGAQPFYPAPDQRGLGFAFDSCTAALYAFRERRPQLLELVAALGVAELEVTGAYRPERHRRFFADLASGRLPIDARDLALFPDYFVHLNAASLDPLEQEALFTILDHGLPIKVLIEIDQVLSHSMPDDAAVGRARARHIAGLATGAGTAFVLQAPSSHLVQLREPIARGFAHRGPAIFSVFTGASPDIPGLSPYLAGALALETRVFPAFVSDPGAPSDAGFIDLATNPQVAADWPVYAVDYEAGAHQRASAAVALTAADFIACDRRHTRHFAPLDRDASGDELVPLDRWLAMDHTDRRRSVPFIEMVNADNRLQRVLVDAAVVAEVEEYREAWRRLRRLARSAPPPERLGPVQEATPAPPTAAPVLPSEAGAAPAVAPERVVGDPYIETPRCASCNECLQINSRMFLYDSNGQAYIADLDAGTFRDLVEAAESCQVAIIHPGTPRRADEPGLEDLLQRAATFQ